MNAAAAADRHEINLSHLPHTDDMHVTDETNCFLNSRHYLNLHINVLYTKLCSWRDSSMKVYDVGQVRGVFRESCVCPPPWRWKNVLIFNLKNWAKIWTLENVYVNCTPFRFLNTPAGSGSDQMVSFGPGVTNMVKTAKPDVCRSSQGECYDLSARTTLGNKKKIHYDVKTGS